MIAINNNDGGLALKQRLLLGAITLSVGLAGCAAQSAPESGPQQTSIEGAQSAPAVRSSGTPSPTASVVVAKEDMKFYVGDSDNFRTFKDVQEAAQLKVDDIPSMIDAVDVAVSRMEDAANYLPSTKSVSASVKKPAEQLTKEDYLLVGNYYLDAHKVMFSPASGEMYSTLRKTAEQVSYDHLISVAENAAVPYAIKFTLHHNNTGLRIDDNSDTNTSSMVGDYKLRSIGGNDIIADNSGNWHVAGNIGMTKVVN
jgi:hypothetical protein